MRSSTGKIIAQIGGAAMAVSILLPWYKVEVEQLASMDFSLRELDSVAAYVLVAIGVFCVVQPKLASPDVMATVLMLVGGLATAAIIYKVFVAPPGSQQLKELGIDVAMVKDLLKQMGISFGPTIGAFVGVGGAAAVLGGAFIEFRSGGGGAVARVDGMTAETLTALKQPRPQSVPTQLAPGQQRYIAPRPQAAYAPPPQQQAQSGQ